MRNLKKITYFLILILAFSCNENDEIIELELQNSKIENKTTIIESQSQEKNSSNKKNTESTTRTNIRYDNQIGLQINVLVKFAEGISERQKQNHRESAREKLGLIRSVPCINNLNTEIWTVKNITIEQYFSLFKTSLEGDDDIKQVQYNQTCN